MTSGWSALRHWLCGFCTFSIQPEAPHPDRLTHNSGATSCSQRAVYYCYSSGSCSQSAALIFKVTWPGVIHKVIFALLDKVSADHFISLRPLERSSAWATVATARCPNRALEEVSRRHRGRTLWMTGCSPGGREANKIARRSSRTTLATESRFVYPVPGTEEHRCAVFTHDQKSGLGGAGGLSVCHNHVSGNSFNSRCVQNGFYKQKWQPSRE